MKSILLLIILFATIVVHSQNDVRIKIFSNTHGLRNEGDAYFEVEGYSIFRHDFEEVYYDKGGIKIAKRKYKIDKKEIGTRDSLIQTPHQLFVVDQPVKVSVKGQVIYYFIPLKDERLRVIGFSIDPARDVELERLFVNSIQELSIPNCF